MTLTNRTLRKIIRKLLRGDDYRIEILAHINAEFLRFAVDFFKRVVEAKLGAQSIDADWYRASFLEPGLDKADIATHAGLNIKTIHNMRNSAAKQVVIDASNEHYDELREAITALAEDAGDMEINLSLAFRGVRVDLNLSESLLVINALAVKRAALRGGLWSAAGKRVEAPLMRTLCMLHGVPDSHYALGGQDAVPTADFSREVDFYLLDGAHEYKCEVKLMGKGNPEGADAVIARGGRVFVADKLSDTNKAQLDSLGVAWVELRSDVGFLRFAGVLAELGIVHSELADDWEGESERILKRILA